jgi:thiol-disulfide isomerase/thioredoxin
MKADSMRLLRVSLVSILLVVMLSGCLRGQVGSNDTSELTADNTGIEANSGHGAVSNSQSGNQTSELGRPSPTGKAYSGYLAPDFSYTTLDGASGSLSDLQGKVVLINFWASWCGPCVREMPELDQLAQDYPELNVLAISIDDTEQEARDFATRGGYSFTCVYDEGWQISDLYPTDGIPYTVIINRSGVITKMILGTPQEPYATYQEAIIAAGI